MSSGYSPWIYRKLLYHIPGLFKKCPEGNYHKFWHRLCFCRQNEHCGDWHGGIYDFKTGNEYQPCLYCEPNKFNTANGLLRCPMCGKPEDIEIDEKGKIHKLYNHRKHLGKKI